MNIDKIFTAFLYDDINSNEHLIYKKGDKFIDLLSNEEISYNMIDRNSIINYSNNNIVNYKDWKIREFQRKVKENIDICNPLFSTRANVIKQYLHDRNKLIDIKKYSLMLLKHDIYDRYDSKSDTLYYYVKTDKMATYFKLDDDCYYDIFTGEIFKEKKYHGYTTEPFLESFDIKLDNLLKGNKVLKKDLINYAYRVMVEDRERRK